MNQLGTGRPRPRNARRVIGPVAGAGGGGGMGSQSPEASVRRYGCITSNDFRDTQTRGRYT